MINYTDEQLEKIKKYSGVKKLSISFLNGNEISNIESDRICWETFELIESLCDDDNIRFGSCETSQMSIEVADVDDDIRGQEISLKLTIDDIDIPLGIFYIDSIEKTTSKRRKRLICYDRMYYLQTDVAKWYKQLFSSVDTRISIKDMRNSFFDWFGIEQEDTELPNDSILISKTIDAEEINGLDVISAICEINGVFGHIDRYGRFVYKALVYPNIYPDEDLYPSEETFPGYNENNNVQKISSALRLPDSEYEDHLVRQINALQIKTEEGDVGAIVYSENYDEAYANSYVINNNFLVYGKSHDELTQIAKNISGNIFNLIEYTPNITKFVALPYMEVGDPFELISDSGSYCSYILKRTLQKIQSMTDTFEARGDEFQPEEIRDRNYDFLQLQSRVNILKRTVDENYLEVSKKFVDVDGTITEMGSAITQNAEQISLKVSKNDVISSINQTAEEITIDANKINMNGVTIFLHDESGFVTDDDLGKDGTTVIDGGRIDTVSLFSREITATHLKLTGESSLQLGAKDLSAKQYIYMAGYSDDGVSETGMWPSQFYINTERRSFAVTSYFLGYNKVEIDEEGNQITVPLYSITVGNDGVVQYSAKASHEFVQNVIIHNNIGFVDNSRYIDIVKTLKNARDNNVLKLVDFNGNIIGG